MHSHDWLVRIKEYRLKQKHAEEAIHMPIHTHTHTRTHIHITQEQNNIGNHRQLKKIITDCNSWHLLSIWLWVRCYNQLIAFISSALLSHSWRTHFIFFFFSFLSFLIFIHLFIYLFCFFGATPVSYGSSQARGWIRAAAETYNTAIAPWDPSCICDLCHSMWQHWILNPLSEAKNWTRILTETMSGP